MKKKIPFVWKGTLGGFAICLPNAWGGLSTIDDIVYKTQAEVEVALENYNDVYDRYFKNLPEKDQERLNKLNEKQTL